jgi:hypothetical protein
MFGVIPMTEWIINTKMTNNITSCTSVSVNGTDDDDDDNDFLNTFHTIFAIFITTLSRRVQIMDMYVNI